MSLALKPEITSQELRTDLIVKVQNELCDAYLEDNKPWVVGYSGGKDSTVLLQMVFYMLSRIPLESRKKHVYVLASDTRVETPDITARIIKEFELIQLTAERDNLPISTHIVYPKLNDTFWVNLIGRGYPSPNNHFRWCTDRLKIYPINEFIRQIVDKSGDVIILLGSRKSESNTRAQTMKKHSLNGNRYRPHTSLRRAWVYTPIEELTSNEVWLYLLQVPSPWNGKNKSLVKLYKNANGECPLVIDQSTPSCGHSRFGCWTCTVIETDKSVQSLIRSGQSELSPLLELRDHLKSVRNVSGSRYNHRRNGAVPFRRGTNGTEQLTNTGPYTHDTRKNILFRLLEAQKESGITLVEGDELRVIQEIWNKEEGSHPEKPDSVRTDEVIRIWNSVFEEGSMDKKSLKADHLKEEDVILEEVSKEIGVPFEMMRRLRDLEEEYSHLKRRYGLPEAMREEIQQVALQDDTE